MRPFKIDIKDSVLDDLKTRLKLDLARLKTDHQDPLENAAFTYGFNNDYLTSTLADYWINKYDWKSQEKTLNQFPQFKTSIDGLDIHFIHAKPDPVKSKGKTVLPLLIVHGWPGSFVEFVKILPMLTTPRADQDFVFEVIAPSIPGYGFSSAPQKTGFHLGHAARIFTSLMNRLGHQTFYTQGGDWGALITSVLATIYPSNVRGAHLNMATSETASANLKLLLSQLVPSLILKPSDYKKVIPLGEKFKYILGESGYFHLQATKPDTVGVALNTSPLGLAAYIIEKFSTWTHRDNRNFADGNLTEKFTLDELLNNVMIYWVTGSITSSMRFYAENMGSNQDFLQPCANAPTDVPVGVTTCPQELFVQPENFLTGKFRNIVSYNDLENCGHFLAYEEPKLLAEDVWSFVDKVEKLMAATKSPEKEL